MRCHATVIRVNKFNNLFLRPNLRVKDSSSLTAVLTVLTEKKCLRKEFSCRGRRPQTELLRRMTKMRTKLKKVCCSGKRRSIFYDVCAGSDALCPAVADWWKFCDSRRQCLGRNATVPSTNTSCMRYFCKYPIATRALFATAPVLLNKI